MLTRAFHIIIKTMDPLPPIPLVPLIPLVGVMIMIQPTVPNVLVIFLPTATSMVVFTLGRLRWIVWDYGLRTARNVGLARPACRPIPFAVFAPRAGICRIRQSGICCLPQLADYQRRTQCSGPMATGSVVEMASIFILLRRCLLVAGTNMGSAVRAIMRISGVPLSTIAATRAN